MSVLIHVNRTHDADPDLPLPSYKTPGAAGADLRADTGGRTVTIRPGHRALISTGLRIALPDGYEMQIRPRSGLALKHGLTLANSPGTIDSDYRGPVQVLLLNLGDAPFDVTHGMRIAQGVVAPVVQARWEIAEELSGTDRGGNGFGSTGA
ncbi:dUTP diphosphatase [Jannaschia rubra]|uniref:Deoxyuridine 5'-triphosphate nucleotidohydrolase n=1 Tax=Jannaschia rubra TaxID=282197 RepID=A0A0M6XQK2_9RHOB|nr:dUTP diphosphatase [Jannaschia rubra]CTQ33416.1 Deoxyuridine 5'-triphosphate nucleotidohydrolase [Jannaschia rubra]SFG01314.1 deoxyuridine 5'-triphosphate nucleotidohydrolase [Jannaschia rubra]